MLRPGRYPWADTIGTLTDKAHPGLKSAYNITSTYVHPTYRQLTPEPDIDYLITQAFWITSATIIISAASIAKTDPDFPNCQVDSNLLLLIDAVHQFLTGDSDFSQSTHHPLRDIEPAKKLYVYALMLFSFVYDRDIIEGQPRFT